MVVWGQIETKISKSTKYDRRKGLDKEERNRNNSHGQNTYILATATKQCTTPNADTPSSLDHFITGNL